MSVQVGHLQECASMMILLCGCRYCYRFTRTMSVGTGRCIMMKQYMMPYWCTRTAFWSSASSPLLVTPCVYLIVIRCREKCFENYGAALRKPRLLTSLSKRCFAKIGRMSSHKFLIAVLGTLSCCKRCALTQKTSGFIGSSLHADAPSVFALINQSTNVRQPASGPKRAVAVLTGSAAVRGVVIFDQAHPGMPVKISGNITGLEANSRLLKMYAPFFRRTTGGQEDRLIFETTLQPDYFCGYGYVHSADCCYKSTTIWHFAREKSEPLHVVWYGALISHTFLKNLLNWRMWQ